MRGGVYALKARRDSTGHEQQGRRYAVVLTATRFLAASRWQVVPTSTSASGAIVRPEIDLGGEFGRTVALVDAVDSVDPEHRLGDMVGFLGQDDMRSIERALVLLLGLPDHDDLF